MKYNTAKEKLNLPEYGRNIQEMVNVIKTLPTKEERNNAAKELVEIMSNLYSKSREIKEYKNKLWNYLAIISNNELDVDYPDQVETVNVEVVPEKLEYIKERHKFAHYGRILEDYINEACELEDGEEKDQLVEMIANHMKRSFLTWNRPGVSDMVIFENLARLSHNQLTPPKKLSNIKIQTPKPKSKNEKGKNNDKRKRKYK